jgi:hypothetical protein
VDTTLTPTKVKDYTLQEVDEILEAISNIILYGKRTNKEKAYEKIDEWLDVRLALTNEGGE